MFDPIIRRLLIVSVLLAISPVVLSAQEVDPDALKEALKTIQGTERIDVLCQLGEMESNARHYKRAARYLNEALGMSREMGLRMKELRSLELLAGVYQRDNRPRKVDETELAYRKLKSEIDQEISDKEKGKMKFALDSLDAVLQEAEEANMDLLVANEFIIDENKDIESRNQDILNQLDISIAERLQKEKELAIVMRKRAELEQKAKELENEALRNRLAVEEKQMEIMKIENQVRQQKLTNSLIAALLGIVVLIALFLWYTLRERRKRGEERMVMQKQLLMQEKLASLGQLTAGIAHEIKNPLNFVNNFAEGSAELTEELVETIEENEDKINSEEFGEIKDITIELKQNARDILSNGQRMDRIIHTMMEHARGEKATAIPTDINLLTEDSINLAYHGFRAIDPTFNITIERHFTEGLPDWEVVSQDISRVLLNLLNNACHALHHKKKELGDAFEPVLTVSTRRILDGIEIKVKDNGPGIPDDIKEKIFSPFFTTKPTGEGNIGLGLSISYDIIVEGHGGELKVESKEGEGACFSVYLPKQVAA